MNSFTEYLNIITTTSTIKNTFVVVATCFTHNKCTNLIKN